MPKIGSSRIVRIIPFSQLESGNCWVLDVTFREDKVRYRERTGAQNLAAIRKIIHGVLSKDTKLKCGKQGKRLVAATDPQYREELLKELIWGEPFYDLTISIFSLSFQK